MTSLIAIRGNKANELSKARIMQCSCGSRSLIETRTGVAKNGKNRVINRGTLVYRCAECARIVE